MTEIAIGERGIIALHLPTLSGWGEQWAMDHLMSLTLFVRVVERGAFTKAAADLGISRSTATDAIGRLEKRLGARLLDRTTRHVAATADGLAFYRRCVTILADIEDAQAELRDGEPHGLLRIDAPTLLTRTFLIPALPAFLERHPRIEVAFGQSERIVDLVREGVDCAIRVGDPVDDTLMLRRLGALQEVTVASPDYLIRHGTPQSVDDLSGHRMIGFISSRTGDAMPLEFTVDGELCEHRLPHRVSTNDAETAADLVGLGYGLYQAPRYRFAKALRAGTLVEVMGSFAPRPTPVSALYARTHHPTPRLRAFLDWAGAAFAERLQTL